MNSFLALALLLTGPTHAGDSPVGTIGGARHDPGEHHLSLGIRGGAAFILAGQGQAFGPGPAGGLLLDVPFSEYAGFTVDFEYSGHRVVDANPLFDQDDLFIPLDATAISGSQRFWHADMGFRFDLNPSAAGGYKRSKVRVAPWFRLAGGVSMSDTLLEVATIDGIVPVRTRKPHVTFCPAFGLTIRLPRLVSFRPTLKSVTMLGIDHDEVANTDALRAVFRLQPTLDVMFRF